MDYEFTEKKGLPFGTNMNDLESMGFSDKQSQDLKSDYKKWKKNKKKKDRMRIRIAKKVGDDKSILGTTSDLVQFLLYEIGSMSMKIAEANSLDDVKESVAKLNQNLSGFVNKVDAGEVMLTHTAKGFDVVLPEAEHRCTETSKIIESL